MGVYGALFSAVSGLQAQAQNMGIISDNVSNANTVGYKGTVDKFQTLVTSPATLTTYTPGGVLSRPFANIDAQGLMAASQSQTDIGVSGRGFIPVTNSVSTSGTLNPTVNNLFTRAGSFSVDKNGNMVNAAGFFLLGVPINQTTGQPTTTNPSVQNLSLVNVGTLTGIAKGTTNLAIGANLPAVPTASSPLALSGTLTGLAGGPFNDTGPAGTGFDVASSSGNLYHVNQLTFTFTGANTYSITIPAGGVTVLTTGAAAPVVGPYTLGTLTVGANGSTVAAGAGVTFTDNSTYLPGIDASGLKIGAANTLGETAVEPHDITSVVYDSLGVAQNLTLEFSRQLQTPGGAITAAGEQANTWTVTIKNMTTVATGGPSIVFPTAGGANNFPIYLDGSGATAGGAAPPAQSILRFNTNGTLQSGPTTLPVLQMTTGAANFGGPTFALNLGAVGTPSGMTQFSSQFSVSFLNQNGLAFSFRTGVAFDQNGFVNAIFSNGTTIPLFQIPLVNFSNVDGLEAHTGNVFVQTVQSGSPVANFAGLGGVGTVTPSALEQSTVDLSTEFSNMIITQRSFSANARTITTAATELEEVVNLVR
jgi:flagellar hook protein FlgE